jgi:predicted ATP-grasp superfamily ATP-dependent carboligase
MTCRAFSAGVLKSFDVHLGEEPDQRSMKCRVFVIDDGQERLVIATARSLRRAGYSVTVGASVPWTMSWWSRDVDRRRRIPASDADRGAQAKAIAAITGEGGYVAVLPVNEASLLGMAEERHLFLPSLAAAIPDVDLVLRSTDKHHLEDLAKAVGLAAPRSQVCSTPESVAAATAEFGYPIAVKPGRSQVASGSNAGKTHYEKSVIAATVDERDVAVARMGVPVILQEYIRDARVVSYAGLRMNGEFVGEVVSEYVRTWPPGGGSASYSVTIAPDDGLLRDARALVDALRWEGIFELELIARPGGGYAAIDFNPRIYGSIALATAAGVDLPAMWVDSLTGRPVERRSGRAGVTYRWEHAELLNLFNALGRRDLRGAVRIATSPLRSTYPILSVRDPGPIIVLSLGILRRQIRGLARTLTRRR